MKPEIVVWLVRDTCRLFDNPALRRASTLAKSIGAQLVPLACLEPRRWADQQFGLPRGGSIGLVFAQRVFSPYVTISPREDVGSGSVPKNQCVR